MKHYAKQEWDLYVAEQIPPSEMSIMELHLYQCDSCLSLYMQSLEVASGSLPHPETDYQTYMDAILDRTMRTKPAWYRSTLFHYGIAAAATLILVASGFFHGLSQDIEAFSDRGFSKTPSTFEQKQPLSEHLLDRTLTWLDHIQTPENKGGY